MATSLLVFITYDFQFGNFELKNGTWTLQVLLIIFYV